MIPASRLVSLQIDELRVMKQLEEELGRESKAATTLEEHFAERTWEGLFSYPLSKNQTSELLDTKSNIYIREESYFGILQSKENQCPKNNYFYDLSKPTE